MSTDYAGLVEYIVKNIVENPDAVEVDGNSRRHRSQTVEVRLDPSDVGRVIGKGGKNIEAIRAVVKAAAIKDHQRVNVEVVTDDDLAEDAEDSAEHGEGQAAVGESAAAPQEATAEPVETAVGKESEG
ncbi:MAG: KH domain-containing protein [Candidatus Dormibacteria bacterium]